MESKNDSYPYNNSNDIGRIASSLSDDTCKNSNENKIPFDIENGMVVSSNMNNNRILESSNESDQRINENNNDNNSNNNDSSISHNVNTSSSSNSSSTSHVYNSILSNEGLLIVAFISFATFACIQMIFAIYIAHSHAMIGDSSVMMLDALTYLFNGYSERRKKYYYNLYIQQQQEQLLVLSSSSSSSSSRQTDETSIEDDNDHEAGFGRSRGKKDDRISTDNLSIQQQHQPSADRNEVEVQEDNDDNIDIVLLRMELQYRKLIVQQETMAPSISFIALIIITIMITKAATQTLQRIEFNDNNQDENNENQNQNRQPNLYIIFSFSMLNLLLDVFNMYFFTRQRKQIASVSSSTSSVQSTTNMNRNTSNNINNNNNANRDTDGKNEVIEETISSRNRNEHKRYSKYYQYQPIPNGKSSNLNICSAYTHVLADTLRSISVIVAVLFALLLHIEPALADATATLIVSFLIAISLIPLTQGLYCNIYELYTIRQTLRLVSSSSSSMTNTQ